MTKQLKSKMFDQLNYSPSTTTGSWSSVGSATDLGARIQKADQIMFVQMELCKRTLRDWLTDRRKVDRTASLKIFKGIVSGLAYTHSMGLMHRDLKPANIFLVDGDRPDDLPVAKIGDFGLACSQPTPGSGQRMTRDLGTPSYSSPEQRTHFYDEAVDVYPLGLILFEMLWNFGTAHQRVKVFNELKRGLGHAQFRQQFPRVFRIIDNLLARKASHRPTAETLLQHIEGLITAAAPAMTAATAIPQHVAEEMRNLRRLVAKLRGEAKNDGSEDSLVSINGIANNCLNVA